ncbi:hypothetical protein HG442_000510 [Candidatus Gracilibacteria bacterium]|nr:hypothetical protein [Candidatus Gracilibacteria bacterium]
MKKISRETPMADISDFEDNGGYFYPLHLQIITEKGRQNGFFSKGYCTKEDRDTISAYTLDPTNFFILAE